MKNIKFLLVIILLFQNLFAQTITGKTVDSTGKAVAYVNIGIHLKNIGTVSDFKGEFVLDISRSNINDTVLFSMLGYKTSGIPVKELLKDNSLKLIKLKSVSYKIDEVIIMPKKYKFKTFGNTFNDKNRRAGHKFDKLGNEIGVLMKNKKLGIINSVNFNIAKCIYDTLFLRVNIYNFEKDSILNNIMKKPYYLNISIDEIDKNEYVTIKILSKKLGLSTTAIENNVKKLKNKRLLSRVGGDKGGSWKLIG